LLNINNLKTDTKPKTLLRDKDINKI